MGAETEWLRSVGTDDLFSVIGEPQTGPFLSPEAAGRGLPVRLEGVVTHYHRRLGYGFTVQDGTDGV